MQINLIEIINLVIALCLIFLIKRQRDAATLLIILFFYGSLHFGFASIALATQDSTNLLITLHHEGGGMLAKLAFLVLVGSIFILLSRRAFNLWVMKPWAEMKVELYILLIMMLVFCGYISNIRYGDWLQLKNVISIEMMLFLTLVGYGALADTHWNKVSLIYSWGLGGLVILFVADCVAFYEVFAHKSWAGTFESSGAMVYRASSFLFNPNLLGLWASLVYLMSAYGFNMCERHRRMMLWGMAMASIAIYFSGSRSAGYLLAGVLFISALLLKDRLRWVVIALFPFMMIGIYSGAKFAESVAVNNYAGWHSIVLLGDRFVVAPIYLVKFLLLLAGVPIEVPFEINTAIQGRYEGDGRDAGWLVLYQDVGWLGLMALTLAAFMLISWGVRAYAARRNPSNVYALGMLLYCLLIGFVMKFQIFPIWLFISLVAILCLTYWRQLALPPLRIRN